MIEKKRIEWIDSAKGIGIILVVIGHTLSVSNPGFFNSWIFSFHMPFFFILSGFTLSIEKYSIKQFINRKTITLLIPYFIYGLLGYLFYISGYFATSIIGVEIEQFNYGLLKPFIGIGYGSLGNGYLVNGPIWFLLSLFLASIILKIIHTFISNNYIAWFITVIIFLSTIFIKQGTQLPLSLLPTAGSLFFLQTGFSIKGLVKNHVINKLSVAIAILLLISSILFSMLNRFVIMGEFYFGNYLIFIITALTGSSAFILISKTLKSNSLLKILGIHSISIMVVHILVLKTVKVMLSIFLNKTIPIIETNYLLSGFVFILSSIIIFVLVYLINKYFPWTIGKFRKSK